MKKLIFGLLLLNSSVIAIYAEVMSDWQSLQQLLEQEVPYYLGLRAPVVPSALGNSLGMFLFKGYNGSTLALGSKIEGYYGIVGSGVAAPNVNMPGSIGVTTVPTPSVGDNSTARLLVSAAGYVGVGNFTPGTGTNNGLPNTVLNVEGDNTATAGSALHVGSRVTAISPFVSGTAYSAQVDGNLYDANFSTFNTNLTVTQTFNIVQTTFVRASDLPLTISTPGLYCFAENITTAAATAITVTAAGAGSTIDFKDFSLTGSGATAILLANTNNITIKNGKINGFTTASISATTASANIVIDNLTFNNFAKAIVTAGSPHNNWKIGACLFTNSSIADAVVDLINVRNGLVTDCVINNCTGTNFIGFNADTCARCTFYNCAVTDCSNPSGGFIGFELQGSMALGIIYEMCDASNNTCSGNMRPFRLTLPGTLAEMTNCTSYNNSGSNTQAFTLNAISGNIDCLLRGCIAAGNSSANVIVGFYVSNPNAVLEDCIAYGNTTSTVSSGFNIDGTTNVVLNRCIAFAQLGNNNANSIGINVNVAAGTSGSLITNCTTFGQGVGTRIGSATFNTLNQFIENVSAKNIGNNYLNFPAGAFQTAPILDNINANLTIPWANVALT